MPSWPQPRLPQVTPQPHPPICAPATFPAWAPAACAPSLDSGSSLAPARRAHLPAAPAQDSGRRRSADMPVWGMDSHGADSPGRGRLSRSGKSHSTCFGVFLVIVCVCILRYPVLLAGPHRGGARGECSILEREGVSRGFETSPTFADQRPLRSGIFHPSAASLFPLAGLAPQVGHVTQLMFPPPPQASDSAKTLPPKSPHLELHGTVVSARPGVSPDPTPSFDTSSLLCPGQSRQLIAHTAVCVRMRVRCQVITIKILLSRSVPWREGTSCEVPELGAHGGRASRCHCPPILYRAAVAISPWTSHRAP